MPRGITSRWAATWAESGAADFPLTSFASHLKALQTKLLHGNGIEVLRGLPVAGYSPQFAATVFCRHRCGPVFGQRPLAKRRRPHPRPCARPRRSPPKTPTPDLPNI